MKKTNLKIMLFLLVASMCGLYAEVPSAIELMDEVQPSKREIYSWYENLPEIRTKTGDPTPASVIVQVVLGYTADDTDAKNEITARRVEIQDYLRKYFNSKKLIELIPQNEDALMLEIKNGINDILISSSIKDVRFLTLEIIEQ